MEYVASAGHVCFPIMNSHFQGVCIFVMTGVGHQGYGSIAICISYFGFAWSLGIPLMFATHLKLAGLWWGFVLGAASLDLTGFIFMCVINWEKEAAKVMYLSIDCRDRVYSPYIWFRH